MMGNATCRWIQLARERHERDLQTGHERGLWFDQDAANRIVKFYGYLKLDSGEWGNKPFVLTDMQEFDLTRPLFGWKRLPPGLTVRQVERMTPNERRAAGVMRRFRTAYIEVPKKWGKTTWGAGAIGYLLIGDGEYGAQVYCVATKRDQARLAFNTASNMFRLSPAIHKRATVGKNAIGYEKLCGYLKPLSSDVNTEDGFNPHGALIDEYHRHKTDSLRNLVIASASTRQQPLVLTITTAGEGTHGPCWRERQYGESLLRQVPGFENDSHFVFISAADQDDPWDEEDTWKKANPHLGVTVKIEFVRDLCQTAKGNPSAIRDFRRFILNQWLSANEAPWIDPDIWRDLKDGEFPETRLARRPCYGGLDLSWTTDLTALVLLFPPWQDDPQYRVKSFFWVPGDRIEKRVKQDRVPYDVWTSQGWITATPGQVVDYGYVKDRILQVASEYDVKAIGYDPYNARTFIQMMEDSGYSQLVEVKQTPGQLNGAMKEIERQLLQRNMRHDGNPVMHWCFGNVVVQTSMHGNIAPDKKHARERIDGVSALLSAARIGIFQERPQTFSYGGM